MRPSVLGPFHERSPAPEIQDAAQILSIRTTRYIVTGNVLLKRSRRAMAYVSESAIRLSRVRSARITPFLRATAVAARSLQSLDEALALRKSSAFARAMSASSSAIGRLNATYRLAGFSDAQLREGLRALNVSWRLFGRSSGRGLGQVTAGQRLSNGRRIAALRRRLIALRQQRSQSVEEVTQIDYLINDLNRASRSNRRRGYEWQALNTINSVVGRFGGYYDYLAITNPLAASAYSADYSYFRSVDSYISSSSESYYNETSWSSYNESYQVRQNSELNVSTQESTRIDREMNDSGSRIEATAADAKESQALNEAESRSSPVPTGTTNEDPANQPDPETDAQTGQELDPASAQTGEDPNGSTDPQGAGSDSGPQDPGNAGRSPADADADGDEDKAGDDGDKAGDAADDGSQNDGADDRDGNGGNDAGDSDDSSGSGDGDDGSDDGGGDDGGGNDGGSGSNDDGGDE